MILATSLSQLSRPMPSRHHISMAVPTAESLHKSCNNTRVHTSPVSNAGDDDDDDDDGDAHNENIIIIVPEKGATVHG